MVTTARICDFTLVGDDARAFDADALGAMYAQLAPAVHRFLRDLLGDATLAKDATQETFVRAFRRVGEIPRGVRPAAWVFGIARNVSLELRKARGRARRVIDDGGLPDEPRVACGRRTPEGELLDREIVAVMERAIGAMSDDRRAAVLLRLDHGLAYEEIAEMLGWSVSKAKVEIFRARETLRATLGAYRGGET